MKQRNNNKLAVRMLTAMVGGILIGLVFLTARECLGAKSRIWNVINSLLFQDITAP